MAFLRMAWARRLRVVAERWKLPSYARPQAYQFRYQVRLPNNWDAPQTVMVVCPLPRTLAYQKVTDLRYQVIPDGVGEEQHYGNRFAWWRVDVPMRQDRPLGYDATVAVQPRATIVPAGLPLAGTARGGDLYLEVTAAVQGIAARLSDGAGDRHAYISRCYAYVVSRLRYGNPIAGLYRASDALQLPAVDCGGFNSLLGALLLARGIPARVVSGFWAGYPDAGMHAWLECESTPETWVPLDPSVDHLNRSGRSRKSGRQYFVGSDRIALCVGTDLQFSLAGNPVRVALLQHPYAGGKIFAPLLADVRVVRL